MHFVKSTKAFDKWLSSMKDHAGKARILVALKRLELGQPVDCKNLRHGLYELRVHYGPGYRVYFHQKGEVIVILLNGGHKSNQSRDIEKAKFLLKELEAS
ncbi:MAG: type II toxin-antitoxin system RelE/ParE family toxin [Endozoicomonas sp.]|uniref:type II toxin-antitoxin system RelE/ParE family toxin n=1 Tax=Endozoicomonas sp. TaxID=1892382 RepID=UPI003D9AC47E